MFVKNSTFLLSYYEKHEKVSNDNVYKNLNIIKQHGKRRKTR